MACGECSSCRRIARDVFPDVSVIDLASQAERDRDKSRNQTLNIASVREVRAAVAYRPVEAPWRIVIVDDAETMQESAQEAFLKTLEEPPSYAIIILLVADTERLLDTIRSRCTEIRFGRSSHQAVIDMLQANGVASIVAERIAQHADGLIGWALSAAQNPTLAAERDEIRHRALEMVLEEPYKRLLAAIRLADGWADNRALISQEVDALLWIWRELLFSRLGATHSDLASHVENLEPLQITAAIASIEHCRQSLEANVRPRLALEAMVASWPSLASSHSS